MKTYNHLFEKILSFDNLLSAARKAQKGKRQKANVSRFNFNMENELLVLKEQLQNKTYKPGDYTTFMIYEPKQRMISAAPYRDRVVHHALCNVIEPLFENTFIFDSYANRLGKGTHKAILRYQQFMRKKHYVIKADIKSFFPSIDHEILKTIIRRKIRCKDTLRLIDLIIDNSNPQKEAIEYFSGDDLFTPFHRKKGLPIGNLTSQFFANVYLNPLDHFIKEGLRCQYYIRYVDDFVIFQSDKTACHEVIASISSFLESYRLKMHGEKTMIYPVDYGVAFLGHRVFRNYRLLKKENVRRFKKRLKIRIKRVKNGILNLDKFWEQLKSWGAHARFSNTYLLRATIFKRIKTEGISPL